MKTLLCILCLFAVPSSTFAQGFFVHQGLSVGVGYSSQKGQSVLSTGAGYVLNGVFEFGLDVARVFNDESDITVIGVAPFVGVYPVRQSDAFPLTVRFGAGYEVDSFSGDAVDALEELGVDVSGTAWGVGVGIAHTASASTTVELVPRAAFYFTSATVELSDFSGSVDETTEFETISFSLSIVIQTAKSSYFYATPSLYLSDGNAVLGVGVGIILAASER